MGILERDYVMRLVKQVVDLLALALGLKKAGKFDEAIQVLENGCLSLLGMPYSALALVDSKSAADLLGQPARVVAFGRLLEERASVEEAKGDLLAAASRRLHATEIYLEALTRAPAQHDAQEGLARLRPLIDVARLKDRYATALAAV